MTTARPTGRWIPCSRAWRIARSGTVTANSAACAFPISGRLRQRRATAVTVGSSAGCRRRCRRPSAPARIGPAGWPGRTATRKRAPCCGNRFGQGSYVCAACLAMSHSENDLLAEILRTGDRGQPDRRCCCAPVISVTSSLSQASRTRQRCWRGRPAAWRQARPGTVRRWPLLPAGRGSGAADETLRTAAPSAAPVRKRRGERSMASGFRCESRVRFRAARRPCASGISSTCGPWTGRPVTWRHEARRSRRAC